MIYWIYKLYNVALKYIDPNELERRWMYVENESQKFASSHRNHGRWAH